MDQEKKKLLVFGYGMAAILAFVAVRLWIKHGAVFVPSLLFGFAAALLGITLLNHKWLKLVYQGWMRIARVIGFVVTSVVLTLIYYSLFGVIGIILRLLKKDLLDQTIEPERSSYWNKRKDVVKEQKSYLQQF